MITSLHGPETEPIQITKKVRNKDKVTIQVHNLNRPKAISDYNQNMAGVDIFDQKIGYYRIPRRTVKWSKKMAFYLLQIGLQNAHTLYQKYSTEKKKLTLLQFHVKMSQTLINFDEKEWPKDNSCSIPHAQPLDPEQQFKSPRKRANVTSTAAAPIPASPAEAILQCNSEPSRNVQPLLNDSLQSDQSVEIPVREPSPIPSTSTFIPRQFHT